MTGIIAQRILTAVRSKGRYVTVGSRDFAVARTLAEQGHIALTVQTEYYNVRHGQGQYGSTQQRLHVYALCTAVGA